MKRPSNLIITFVLSIASVFIVFALGRMAIAFLSPTDTETELENTYLLEE